METEEINMKLYEKMKAELSVYRASLLDMPSEQILQNAYEYVIKEDLVYILMENNLNRKDADTLLKSETPLHDCFIKFELLGSNYPQTLLRAIRARAHDIQHQESNNRQPSRDEGR